MILDYSANKNTLKLLLLERVPVGCQLFNFDLLADCGNCKPDFCIKNKICDNSLFHLGGGPVPPLPTGQCKSGHLGIVGAVCALAISETAIKIAT
jgi:hypothetical protein